LEKTTKNFDTSFLFWILTAFSFAYLGFTFPFSYFRHDDWLMIGNVARIIPTNWKFIFEPYLVFNSVPDVWFFRPWFKLILYVLYHAFGFHYYSWLAVNLLFTVGALILGYQTIKETTNDRSRAIVFVLFFVFSIHFHFASLVWVGEGTMNCPQIFLLFLNFYLFNKSLIQPKKQAQIYYFLGVLAFVFSLGFKEAAVFHLPFLLLILFHPNQKSDLTFKRKCFLLAPYFILACIYLYYRLFMVPFNPGYKPRGDLSWFLTPILFILAALLIPTGSMILGSIKNSSERLKDIIAIIKSCAYLVFLVPFFITYMGHGFFSPGWLLAPGFYFAFIFGLFCPTPLRKTKILTTSIILTLLLSTTLVLYQTNELSWWSWYRPQRQILEIIKEVGTPQTETVRIFNCEDQGQKLPHLHRVVGYSDSIQEIFWLVHKKLPQVHVLPCQEIGISTTPKTSNSLNLKWSFPEFLVLAN